MIPSYGGAPIFGFNVTMETAYLQRERQVNSFFGLDGLEVLDGGARGAETVVAGCVFGDGQAGLAAAKATFRSFQDGAERTLVDTDGVAWGNTILDKVQFRGRRKQTPQGVWWQEYEAVFLHATPPADE